MPTPRNRGGLYGECCGFCNSQSKYVISLTVVIQAYCISTVRFTWDVECFIEHSMKLAFRNYIPKERPLALTTPTTVMDVHSRILIWHLPGVFLQYRIVRAILYTIVSTYLKYNIHFRSK